MFYYLIFLFLPYEYLRDGLIVICHTTSMTLECISIIIIDKQFVMILIEKNIVMVVRRYLRGADLIFQNFRRNDKIKNPYCIQHT